MNPSYDDIRPVILAGGLGMRLRPRTEYLPKPMLPVDGRPILWYVLNNLKKYNLKVPIVSLDYKAEIIKSFFSLENIEFQVLPERTMIETMLEICEKDNSRAFLGFSSDVLIPPIAIKEILNDYSKINQNCVLFANLPKPGHKKWEFIVKEKRLQQIIIKETNTHFERVILLLKKDDLERVRLFLGQDITEQTIPNNFKPYNSGWILIMKVLIELGINIHARIVDIPVWNINTPNDFYYADSFVRSNLL